MSDPGISTAQLTPEFLQQMQQYQEMQKRQQMAQSLMSPNADPRTPNAGIANAGGSIMGALTARDMQANAAQQAQARMPASAFPSADTGYGMVSSKTPALPQQSWLKNLFSFGGGS